MNFGAMAGRLKQTIPLLDSNNKIVTEENLVNDKKYNATLMNADGSNHHLFFLQVWDPSNQKALCNKNKPLLSKWHDLIFDNEHTTGAKSTNQDDDSTLKKDTTNAECPNKIASVNKLAKSNAKLAIQSMINLSRKISVFKETLFNTKVEVRKSYATLLMAILTIPLFFLLGMLAYNLILLASTRCHKFNVLNTEIEVWENAWKIIETVSDIKQYKENFGLLVASPIANESVLMVN